MSVGHNGETSGGLDSTEAAEQYARQLQSVGEPVRLP